MDRSLIRCALPLLILAGACADGPVAPLDAAFAHSPSSAASPFVDPFDAWDPGRWEAGDHGLGKGWLRPANVSVSAGLLRLRTPAGTFDGGEITTLDRYAEGSFRVSMRCGLPAGTLCAFFLYEGVPGDRNDEIDIELPGGTDRMWMTTWMRGRQTNHAEIVLPFDPAAGFHEYRIDWSRGNVEFRVDGQLVQRWTRKVPGRPMKVYTNAWWPVWLSEPPAAADRFLEVDWISAG